MLLLFQHDKQVCKYYVKKSNNPKIRVQFLTAINKSFLYLLGCECYFPDVIYIHETESVEDQTFGDLLLTAMETSLLTIYISVNFSGGSAAQEMKKSLVTC